MENEYKIYMFLDCRRGGITVTSVGVTHTRHLLIRVVFSGSNVNADGIRMGWRVLLILPSGKHHIARLC